MATVSKVLAFRSALDVEPLKLEQLTRPLVLIARDNHPPAGGLVWAGALRLILSLVFSVPAFALLGAFANQGMPVIHIALRGLVVACQPNCRVGQDSHEYHGVGGMQGNNGPIWCEVSPFPRARRYREWTFFCRCALPKTHLHTLTKSGDDGVECGLPQLKLHQWWAARFRSMAINKACSAPLLKGRACIAPQAMRR